MNPESIEIERFDPQEHLSFVEPLTNLLHDAYSPLAARGMKYLASHQPPTKTLERLLEGESYLFFLKPQLVGTVTLYKEKYESSCEYYRKNGVYSFGQFATKPSLQGKGIGTRVMDYLENRAKELGAIELALDTSEHADNLIQMYKKRSYEIVAYTKWDVVNYRSEIMSKKL